MAIFGAGAYAALLRRAALPEPNARYVRVLFVIAATLALISAIAWFSLIAGQMSGSWQGSVDPAVLELAASGTRFGQIFVGRFIGLGVLWFLCILRQRGLVVSALAALLLASLAPISHAAAAGAGDLGAINAMGDATHLLTGGFWLGGLLVLAMLVPSHRADPAGLLGPLRLFSIWGSYAVALLVVSGLINAFSILSLSAMSLRNAYFDVLLVKVGLALAMIALAALNRWRFAPALRNGGGRATRNLASSIGAEIALGVTVVGIAGYLGLMPPH
ncbi:MAG TPA: CopD family protein [Sphingomicrobium sp.]|nr:CopD family protein [Sphingomicrobium sp.]